MEWLYDFEKNQINPSKLTVSGLRPLNAGLYIFATNGVSPNGLLLISPIGASLFVAKYIV